MKQMGFRWRRQRQTARFLWKNLIIYAVLNNIAKKIDQWFTVDAQQKSWGGNKNTKLRQPLSKGQRMININSGNETEIVPNAQLILKS